MQTPSKNSSRRGFTIIEVVLFLGISAFLIVGLIVGTSATIARQRYNDSVQDFAEFLRREYSAVINPENGRDGRLEDIRCTGGATGGTTDVATEDNPSTDGISRGRSSCLIYGRLIVFGERDDPNTLANESDIIYSYDVIGEDLGGNASTDLLCSLGNCSERSEDGTFMQAGASISVLVNNPNAAGCQYEPVGQYQYTPQWLSKIQGTGYDEFLAADTPIRAAVLIVRAPSSSAVHTLVYNDAVEVQEAIRGSMGCTSGSTSPLLWEKLVAGGETEHFEAKEIDFCVGSEDVFALDGLRRNIRIARDGRNSSAVQVVAQDFTYDPDNPEDTLGGNRCRR